MCAEGGRNPGGAKAAARRGELIPETWATQVVARLAAVRRQVVAAMVLLQKQLVNHYSLMGCFPTPLPCHIDTFGSPHEFPRKLDPNCWPSQSSLILLKFWFNLQGGVLEEEIGGEQGDLPAQGALPAPRQLPAQGERRAQGEMPAARETVSQNQNV